MYITHTLFKDLLHNILNFWTVRCSDYCTTKWSLPCHHFPPKKDVRLHSQRSRVIITFRMKLPVWGISESRDLCFEDAESSRWALGSENLQWFSDDDDYDSKDDDRIVRLCWCCNDSQRCIDAYWYTFGWNQTAKELPENLTIRALLGWLQPFGTEMEHTLFWSALPTVFFNFTCHKTHSVFNLTEASRRNFEASESKKGMLTCQLLKKAHVLKSTNQGMQMSFSCHWGGD